MVQATGKAQFGGVNDGFSSAAYHSPGINDEPDEAAAATMIAKLSVIQSLATALLPICYLSGREARNFFASTIERITPQSGCALRRIKTAELAAPH